MTQSTVQYAGQLDDVNAFEMGQQCFKDGGTVANNNPADLYLINTMDDIEVLEEFMIGFEAGWNEAESTPVVVEEVVVVKELMFG